MKFEKDADGNTVLSKLNEGQLKQLAATTNGIYINPDNVNDAVDAIIKQLSAIQESAVEDAAFKDYIHYFQWFVGAAILLLVIEFMLPERKRRIA